MLFTFGFRKFISNVKVLTFKRKFQNFYLEIEFRKKFPIRKRLNEIWGLILIHISGMAEA